MCTRLRLAIGKDSHQVRSIAVLVLPNINHDIDGEIAKNYKMKTVKWHGGHDVTVVDPSDITRFYDDFYR